MRLWSVHPHYLDAKGLVALWREGLLALNVLQGKTKGYKNHPQLERFKAADDPVTAIACYLHGVVDEAERRGYAFKREKLPEQKACSSIAVHTGQLAYEVEHLLGKLKVRDMERYEALRALAEVETHPLFYTVEGGVEAWEVITPAQQ